MDNTLPPPTARSVTRPARSGASAAARSHRRGRLDWHRPALAAVLLLSALLGGLRIDNQGLGNAYYAATVKSMLANWHNFFFVAFDPGGFVSVDKPPVGYWIQAASARLFGFSGPSLLLPQAVAAVLSVAVLFALVRRTFGAPAGLLAALTLALTPLVVAVSRNNTVDVPLVLALLAGGWALLRAADQGSLPWLLLAAGLVGLGFNIKMLQAFLVVPAFWSVYLLGSPLGWPKRLRHLTAATAVLLAVSLSWAIAVDLTPAAERPYVGSSSDNSVLNLIVGYNGLARLLPMELLSRVAGGAGPELPIPGGAANPEIGAPGILRLFGPQFAGQIGWLLPLAAVGLVAAWWQEPARLPLGPRHRALLLWGGWLLTAAAFFSFASIYHRHYLVMLAPPIAALVGAGLAAMWADYRGTGKRGWLLPAVLAATAVFHATILAPTPEWAVRLTPAILVFGLGAALALAVARLRPRHVGVRGAQAAAALGVVAIVLGPATWSGVTTWEGANNVLPAGGPGGGFAGFGPLPTDPPDGSADDRQPRQLSGANQFDFFGGADPKLVAFLRANRGDARFLLATANASTAAPYILETGEPVAALGGFLGSDPILTDAELAAAVGAGDIRYVLGPSRAQSERMQSLIGPAMAAFGGNLGWVNDHCVEVPVTDWRSDPDGDTAMFADMQTLFDCAGRRPPSGT